MSELNPPIEKSEKKNKKIKREKESWKQAIDEKERERGCFKTYDQSRKTKLSSF